MPLIDLGTAPTGSDGDTVREAFTKLNIALPFIDVRTGGVLAANSAATNLTNLQALIDAGTDDGVVLVFSEPVACNGPVVLKSNVHLQGNNVSAFKGSRPEGGGSIDFNATPSGAAFLVTDTTNPLIQMQSNTSVTGFVFHYPNQEFQTTDPAAELITYPATITKHTGKISSISLQRLAFVGATECMDFEGDSTNWMSDIEVDLCYGYPLGGAFLKLGSVYDIPRVTRCHVNPGCGNNYLNFWSTGNGVSYTNEIIDWVGAVGAATFDISDNDEFMLALNFVFGVNTGFKIDNSYGTITQCMADMVETGIHATLSSAQKYLNVTQFNCVPGAGTLGDRNAVLIDGTGGAFIGVGISGFTGTNAVVPASGTPGANSLVKVAGSGAHRVMLTHPRTSAIAGSWSHFINQTNADAIVTYSDSAQGNVSSTTNGGKLIDTELNVLALGEDTDVANIVSETADRLIRITIDGVAYDLFAMLAVTATTLFEDSFTGANGTALTSHTPELGTWLSDDDWEIQSNRAESASSGDIKAKADVAADGTITAICQGPSASAVGIRFRESADATDFYTFQINGIGTTPTAYITNDGGIIDSDAGISINADTNFTIKVVLNGASVKCYFNGALIFDETDAVYAANTRIGILTDTAGGKVDSFIMTDATTP